MVARPVWVGGTNPLLLASIDPGAAGEPGACMEENIDSRAGRAGVSPASSDGQVFHRAESNSVSWIVRLRPSLASCPLHACPILMDIPRRARAVTMAVGHPNEPESLKLKLDRGSTH